MAATAEKIALGRGRSFRAVSPAHHRKRYLYRRTKEFCMPTLAEQLAGMREKFCLGARARQ
jgi:hypothetical protein